MAQLETDHRHDFDIDLNTAREDELARLPMIGPERAEALVARRPFNTWGDVIAVPGIDGGLVTALRDGGARLGFATEPHVHEASPEERSKPEWHGVDAEPETG
ncbi:MAG: helix-hairpin-helix domain-containing protein [Alphaproteobacteria bacterium]|nr:helix-hairpin-helix domain-containing protein [Alphaproteobacteria bacterium]